MILASRDLALPTIWPGRSRSSSSLGGSAGPHEKRAFDHLVPLENLGAHVDELLSYYLWADDIGPDGQPRRTTSDMFFAEVRPFEEIFREGQAQDPNAQQQQQPGQQGQNAAEKLAELQKQIITATWNIQRRETGKTPTANFKPDAATVKESQENALEQVRSRIEQSEDPRAKALLQTVEKEMAKAVEHLTDAADDNSPKALPPALSAEQSAYQALLRLAARETQVSQSQPGQPGQSSRGQRAQRQLDQLDLRQSQNRYETERQAAPPQNPQQREQLQAFNRLKELAQRQQDVNERLKELQAALSAAKTAAEREELRQQLKRLQEEQQQMLADVDELRQRMERPENQSQMAEARQQLDQTRERSAAVRPRRWSAARFRRHCRPARAPSGICSRCGMISAKRIPASSPRTCGSCAVRRANLRRSRKTSAQKLDALTDCDPTQDAH